MSTPLYLELRGHVDVLLEAVVGVGSHLVRDRVAGQVAEHYHVVCSTLGLAYRQRMQIAASARVRFYSTRVSLSWTVNHLSGITDTGGLQDSAPLCTAPGRGHLAHPRIQGWQPHLSHLTVYVPRPLRLDRRDAGAPQDVVGHGIAVGVVFPVHYGVPDDVRGCPRQEERRHQDHAMDHRCGCCRWKIAAVRRKCAGLTSAAVWAVGSIGSTTGTCSTCLSIYTQLAPTMWR